MEWYIKEKPKKEDLEKIFTSVGRKKKGVNVRKYGGKVKSKGNPLELQRRLRNEWD